MLKCPNCGANFDGVECSYCGSKVTKANDGEQLADAFAMTDAFMENIQKSLAGYSKMGVSIMQNFAADAVAQQSEIDKQIETKEKNKRDRESILNGKCPGCGKKIKKIMGLPLSDRCKKCGSIINLNLLNG